MSEMGGPRLDWNGLSFVWTGDGKPDQLTIEYARGADVFVSEMACDLVNPGRSSKGVSFLAHSSRRDHRRESCCGNARAIDPARFTPADQMRP